MAASAQTVREVRTVILKYLDKNTALMLLDDLMHVEGNRSFRDTIQALVHALKSAP